MPSFLIVGSGVFGASTALTLARAGYKDVTVLDRSADGYAAPDSASNDLNKIIRADYSDDSYCSLGKEAISAWRNDPLIKPYYHEVGVVFRSGASRDASSAKQYCERGVVNASRKKDEHLERPAAGAILPREAYLFHSDESARSAFPPQSHAVLGTGISGFGKDGQQCGYVNPRGGWAEANNAVRAYLAEAVRLGVRVVPNAQVTSLIIDDNKRTCKGVRTTDGRSFTADHTVLSPGSWLRRLLANLVPGSSTNTLAPASPSAQCVLTIQLNEKERQIYARTPVVLNFDTGFYLFEPNSDGILKMAIHGETGYQHPTPPAASTDSFPSFEAGRVPSPDAPFSKKGSEPFIPADKEEQMLAELAEVYPELAQRARIAFSRVCWYSDTRDENWVIDHHPDVRGLVVAGGDSGHGYKFLPTIGRLVMARLGLPDVPKLTEHQQRVFSFAHHASLARDQDAGRPIHSSDSGRSAPQVNPRARL